MDREMVVLEIGLIQSFMQLKSLMELYNINIKKAHPNSSRYDINYPAVIDDYLNNLFQSKICMFPNSNLEPGAHPHLNELPLNLTLETLHNKMFHVAYMEHDFIDGFVSAMAEFLSELSMYVQSECNSITENYPEYFDLIPFNFRCRCITDTAIVLDENPIGYSKDVEYYNYYNLSEWVLIERN